MDGNATPGRSPQAGTPAGNPRVRVSQPLGPGDPHPGFRSWDGLVREFRLRHPEWVRGRGNSGEPVYALPEVVIARLASSGSVRRKSIPILDAQQAEAERDFTRLCSGFAPYVVGVWKGKLVEYGLLSGQPLPTPEEARAWGSETPGMLAFLDECGRGNTTELASARGARHRLAAYRQQALGWVGWLMFDTKSGYRRDLEALRNLDRMHGGVIRWPFCVPPDLPTSAASAFGRGSPVPLDRADVLDAAVRLLRRYQLAQLVAWELPYPQGTLEGVPLGLQARLLGEDQEATTFPAYMTGPRGEQLTELVRQSQRRNAEDAGIGSDFPIAGFGGREGQPGEYARAFRMWFIETAARSRFASEDIPWGLVARLTESFAELFEIDDESVRSIRRVYARLFEGGEPRGVSSRPR